jgi:hypothetical protein
MYRSTKIYFALLLICATLASSVLGSNFAPRHTDGSDNNNNNQNNDGNDGNDGNEGQTAQETERPPAFAPEFSLMERLEEFPGNLTFEFFMDAINASGLNETLDGNFLQRFMN